MRFEDFRERGAAVSGLCEAFLTGAPSHATLITGPSGIGKRTLASLCAQSLFCQAEGKPCGQCPACRRYLAGSHPDAHRVVEKKSIGVDEIRALTLSLASAAYEGGFRTVVIECAGAMTVQAQNALLKTLEEPPQRTVFLLTAVNASDMLTTIRSRCRMVHMPPLSAERVREVLIGQGIDDARAARLAQLSQGSVGQALRMHGDEGFWTLRERVFRAVEGVHGPADVLMAVNALKDDKGDAALVLAMLEAALREALMAALTGNTQQRIEAWPPLPPGGDARPLVKLLENTAESRRMLKSNVSWQAVLERLLLDYAEEYQAWR